jgi:uncharacterized phage-associated protein
MPVQTQPEKLRLEPNKTKLLEAILYLIQRGEALGTPLTQYQIVKSLFLADVSHLNVYGRPITFDNYAALEFGPVPVTAYDMLKPENQHNWLWEREPVTSRAYRYVRPSRPPNLRKLSGSDRKVLDEALDRVRELGFGGVRDETHAHRAYVEAWERRGQAASARMQYRLLLESPDDELLEDLVYASRHA